MNLTDALKQKLKDLPDAPGCYLMRDRRGRIIYVGKAASLRKRVQSYFRRATLRSASPKLRGLVHSIHDLEYLVVRNEAEAILTEGRLIKDYRPRYNVSFRDDKRFLLLRTVEEQPFPEFKLCRIQRDDGATYFGPYASSASARATLDFVEKRFGMRKCTPHVPDESAYRHCINDVVRYCSAPCVGKVSREEYRQRFQEACAFLRGERLGILNELRSRMEEAAGQMDFERAAALRDTLLLLEKAVRQRARIASTPEVKAQEAKAGLTELQACLGLASAPRVIEAYDISNISGTYAVASMVAFVDGLPARNRYRRFRIRTVSGADDPRMIGEVIRRRFARLKAEGAAGPDLVLVDGGPTQLHEARRELDQLGFSTPAASLAKRFEEIYRQDAATPVRLVGHSPALRVCQYLRDEAHRFALTYHRRLRSRLIRESALDEVPGIGAVRKRLLLEHFGSVRRLMQAGEAEIAAVAGIGPATAGVIREALGTQHG
jgi:excinuclease ABC subunit C